MTSKSPVAAQTAAATRYLAMETNGQSTTAMGADTLCKSTAGLLSSAALRWRSW